MSITFLAFTSVRRYRAASADATGISASGPRRLQRLRRCLPQRRVLAPVAATFGLGRAKDPFARFANYHTHRSVERTGDDAAEQRYQFG